MIKRISSLLPFLISFVVVCCEQASVTIPDYFVETVPPKAGSDEWFPLNYSQNEFGVKLVNNTLDIQKVKEVNRTELKIANGTLVGINRGEWGGQLTFKPFDTTQKSIEIKRGNIKFVFSFQNKIFFLEGLAHLSISEGALYELDILDSKFAFQKILDFEDAPEALTVYQDELLIATHENFYVVKDFKKELFFKKMFWSSLYPNSIAAIDEKDIFLGMRSGIVKLDLTTKTVKFYKYKG
jgi:hypothetical protein